MKVRLERTSTQFDRRSLDESWQKACEEKNTRLHLIKPMGLELDVGKCIYSDDSILPA